MILKRQSMLLGLGYAAFMTMLDMLVSLLNAHAGPFTHTGLWSPATGFVALSAMLPQPPRTSLIDQLRKPKIQVLIVAAAVTCVVMLCYFRPYTRAFGDFGVLLGLRYDSKMVPTRDIELVSSRSV